MASDTKHFDKVKVDWLYVVRAYILVALSLVALLAVLWSISTVMDYLSRPTFQKFEQAINRELPPGVSPQQVQAFLQRHAFYQSEKPDLLPLDKTWILNNPHGDKLKGKEHKFAYWITGWGHVANWRMELLCGCGRAHVDFYFDEQQKLVEYVAYEYGDG